MREKKKRGLDQRARTHTHKREREISQATRRACTTGGHLLLALPCMSMSVSLRVLFLILSNAFRSPMTDDKAHRQTMHGSPSILNGRAIVFLFFVSDFFLLFLSILIYSSDADKNDAKDNSTSIDCGFAQRTLEGETA